MTAPSAWQLETAMSSLQALTCERDFQSDTDNEALMQAIEAGTETVYELLRRILRAATEADSLADACAARIADLQDRKKRFEARNEALRRTAFVVLDALGETKYKDAEFTVNIRAGSVRPVVTDESLIPDEYKKTTITVDKALINDAVKNGVVIPGVEFSNSMPSLTVRTK